MDLKDLFYRKTPYKLASSASLEEIGKEIESPDYIEAEAANKQRYTPLVEFGTASHFAKFGSAEEYYRKSIQNIYRNYPYDGSLAEKVKWHVSSSYLDNYIFEHEYPRTNGFVTLGYGWTDGVASTVTVTDGTSNDVYKNATTSQYISLKGGPHGPSTPAHQMDPAKLDWKKSEHKANIYNTGSARISNLAIDGALGNTVEFWFKSGENFADDSNQISPSLCTAYFDLHNGKSIGADNYGRLLVETRRTAQNTFRGDKLFYVTYMSGTAGVNRAKIGSTSLASTSTFYKWNHFAFVMENSGRSTSDEGLAIKLYMNGELQETIYTGSAIAEVDEGALAAHIGAYKTAPSSDASSVTSGFGSISGSFDEFRFWKIARNSEKIYRYWFTQVGGGTNTDTANTDLGVYYKFNEGITATSSYDSTTLDYSGRVSNGTINNYDTTATGRHAMRVTGSAMVEASASTAASEFKDPIIYPWHDDVVAFMTSSVIKGREWDYVNPSSMYHSLPEWILAEDMGSTDQDKDLRNLRALTQVLSSYFDELYMQIREVPRLKDRAYLSSSYGKPLPFANKLVEQAGIMMPEMFVDADVLAQFASRDDTKEFTEKLYDVKNLIYQNIYNNLIYIFKTKGTEKSIRNLIRCFGVDDEIYKLNVYAGNLTHTLPVGYNYTVARKSYVDFSHRNRQGATVFQYPDPDVTNAAGYLTASHSVLESGSVGSAFDSGLAVTFEAEAIFPNKPKITDIAHELYSISDVSSSIFGAHSVPKDQTGIDAFTWEQTNAFITDAIDMDGYHASADPSTKFSITIPESAGGAAGPATAEDAIDMNGYQSTADPGCKFTIQVPTAAGGSNTQITIKFDISSASSPTSAGSDHITIATAGSDDNANADLVIKAIKGTTDSRITYGNTSGDGSAGTGVQGLTAQDGTTSTKVTLRMSTGGTAGNVSSVVAHAGGTINLVDESDFTGGNATSTKISIKFSISEASSPANTGADHITIASSENADLDDAALVIKAINGTTDSKITYGNATGPGSAGTGVQGITATAGSTNKKITLTMDAAGTAGNISSAVAHVAGTVNLVDGADFDGGGFDGGSFQVYAVKDETFSQDGSNSENVYFKLKSTDAGVIPTITSPLMRDVYSGKKWNFAVRVKPEKYPHVNYVSGSNKGANHIVEFYGVHMMQDTVLDEFHVSSSITDYSGSLFVTTPKRMYIGAHRTNFTGSVLQKSDAKISSLRCWTIPLTNDEVKAHARDATNVGVYDPYSSAYLMEQSGSGNSYVPKIKTLALNWDFDTVTGSDDTGYIKYVPDASSGSGDTAKFGSLSPILEKQHTGMGRFFGTSDLTSSISREYVHIAREQLPENLNSSNLVQVLTQDDEIYTKDIRPVNYTFALEKSMYQTMSEEMIKYFVGSTLHSSSLDNVIGKPINRYRQSYKELEKLRNLFFADVDNTPDLDKYIDYFKWLDETVSHLVAHLIPGSADFRNVTNMVESHILERNKYWTKFPTLEMKHDDPSGSMRGVNELLYNWRHGHAPENISSDYKLSTIQKDKALWWKNQALRTDDGLTLNDTDKDKSRALIHSATVQIFDREFSSPYRFTGELVETNPVDINKKKSIVYRGQNAGGTFGATAYPDKWLRIVSDYIESDQDINDDKAIRDIKKKKLGFHARFVHSDDTNDNPQDVFKHIAPFNIYSSSAGDPSLSAVKSGIQLTNLHEDVYGNTEDMPMQGPFAKTHVGGSQHRHIGLNTGSTADLPSNRPEGWKLKVVGDEIRVYDPVGWGNATGKDNAENPRAQYYRDEIAKRPFNIKNIKHKTGADLTASSGDPALGNYTKDYQIVQTSGRDVNNPYLVASGSSLNKVDTGFVSGVLDFALPDRGKHDHIIVERFSAPGGPEIMGRGFLDTESETYSVYNALPWRNLTVRRPLHNFLTKSCGQFGMDNPIYNNKNILVAGEEQTIRASYHKINKNPGKRMRLAGALATATLTVSGNPSNGNSFSLSDLKGNTKTLTFRTGHAHTSDGNIGISGATGNNTTIASRIVTAINNFSALRITAKSSAAVVTLTMDDVGTYSETISMSSVDNIANATWSNSSLSDSGGGDSNYITASINDNWYVQHPIPQSEVQYSWINASAETYPLGYSQPNHSNSSGASTDITFVQQGEVGLAMGNSAGNAGRLTYGVATAIAAGTTGFSSGPTSPTVFQNFVGMNTITYLPITASDNHYGYDLGKDQLRYLNANGEGTLPSAMGVQFGAGQSLVGIVRNIAGGAELWREALPSILNNVLLNRNGPYGYPSWKQIRTGEHPVARHMRRNNRISIRVPKNITDSNSIIEAQLNSYKLESYTEPAVVSHHRPLKHLVVLKGGNPVILQHSYANNLVTFSNSGLLAKVEDATIPGAQKSNKALAQQTQIYDNLKKLYITGEVPAQNSPIEGFSAIRQREYLFPRGVNSHLAKTRGRSKYFYDESLNSIQANYKSLSSGSPENKLIWWRDKHQQRTRVEAGSTVDATTSTAANSQGFEIINDSLRGFILADSGSSDAAEQISIPLSIWPLDTEGPDRLTAGAPIFAKSATSGRLIYGGGSSSIGELSHFSDFTIHLADFSPTASLSFFHVQPVAFMGLFNGVTQNTGSSDTPRAHLSHFIPKWKTAETSGRNPWFDSYDDYASDVRQIGKGYSVIPEFRISEYMEEYLNKGIRTTNNQYLSLIGASVTSSADSYGGVFDQDFFKIYSHTDFMKNFTVIKEDHLDSTNIPEGMMRKPAKIKLICNAVKKLLPYNGFYPVNRTMQLGMMFSQSYAPYLVGANYDNSAQDAEDHARRVQSLLQPFFAPGILYNTIKSGVAVDWPTFTGSVKVPEIGSSDYPLISWVSASADDQNAVHNYRFPFEAIVEPDRYIPVSSSHSGQEYKMFHVHPGLMSPSASAVFGGPVSQSAGAGGSSTTAAGRRTSLVHAEWTGESDPKYSLAMHNFLAEVPNFFLKNKNYVTFESVEESKFKTMASGTTYYMDVVMRKPKQMVMWEGPAEYQVPFTEQTTGYTTAMASNTNAASNPVGKRWSARGWGYGPNCQVVNKDNISTIGHANSADLKITSTTTYDGFIYNSSDPSYAPYTPPYFYGSAIARIAFSPHKLRDMFAGSSDKFTLDEILSQADVETTYTNINERAFAIEKGSYFTDVRKATGTVTIATGTPGNLEDKIVTIVAADGTSKIFMFKESGATTGEGGINTERVYVSTREKSSATDIATELKTAIEHANGHKGRITVSQSSGVLTLTMVDPGTAGNNTMTTDAGSGNITVSGFSNGTDVKNLLIDYTFKDHGNLAAKSQMQLSSSMTLFGRRRKKAVTYNADGTVTSLADTSTTDLDTWVVHPKFECPVLNFSGNEGPTTEVDYSISNNLATNADGAFFKPKGMWYGYGDFPTGNEGIFVQLKESYPTAILNAQPRIDESGLPGGLSGSLIDVCGFKPSKERVGEIADTKTISEAIVAIPMNANNEFYKIDKDMFEKQLENISVSNVALKAGDFPDVKNDIKATSITNMINKMKKYVIPPQMNFLLFDDIDPFIMYIFEFSHRLQKQDLANIWQNVMPDIAVTAERSTATIEHPLTSKYEFFGHFTTSNMPDDIKWMVFKVKQKAATNYFATTPETEAEGAFSFKQTKLGENVISKEDELPYSYNWPYDYFSLIEVAKMGAEVEIREMVDPTGISTVSADVPDVTTLTYTQNPPTEQEIKDDDPDAPGIGDGFGTGFNMG